MVSKTFYRYIWLLNILLQKKRLTYKEICNLWQSSSLGDNSPLPLRTFHQNRKEVEELFGVKIKCNSSDGYHYYIADPEKIRNDRTSQWLLNSFSLSNMIIAGHNMNGRILFEEIPHGTEYIQSVIEAMQESKTIEVNYQPFYDSRTTFHMESYAMKVCNRRWYVVGRIVELDAIRHLAFDRILNIEKTKTTYSIPKDFDAKKYYANTVGIYVSKELKVQKVRIRVFGEQVDHLRSLPLHRTQEEVLTRHRLYSEFQYRLCLTPELTTQILAMGESVEVLEPLTLRNEIKAKFEECLARYK